MTPIKLPTLKELLPLAERGGYAVGAFSARYTPFIRAILHAGQRLASPLIVQIAQVELKWYELKLSEFADAFWRQWEEVRPTVPVALHLDHTKDFNLIQEAIELGFSSVMIDASALPLEENIAVTRGVVAYAHSRGVAVEAELGRIGTADFMESDHDEELFTDPLEAERFVQETGVDALAVSVGTAHGAYTVRKPRLDRERLIAIRARTPVHLVLHGGSGTPVDLIAAGIRIPGGGISKINIATDLELGLLSAIGREKRMTEAGLCSIPAADLENGLRAVQAVVEDKILHFLHSDNRAFL
jgi:fructose-bisphosphate aldolase class II